MKYLKVLFFVAIALGILVWREFYTPVSSANEAVFIDIAPGENLDAVAASLKEKNLIRHEGLFSYFVRLKGLDTAIKAGRFSIKPELSPAEILASLVETTSGKITVTVPEGFTIQQIDDRLVSLGLIRSGEFVTATIGIGEGYVFPDTYFVFSKNFSTREFADMMHENFKKKVAKDLAEDFKNSSRTRDEIITMASILEKEVRTKDDLPIVAGILWKRMENGWALQADATLLYGKSDRTISGSDLKEDSPYNTYTNKGLPPTPIGNPGVETIRAALNPKESPYWFYLTDENGTVIYARTNEEHNENKRKFL